MYQVLKPVFRKLETLATQWTWVNATVVVVLEDQQHLQKEGGRQRKCVTLIILFQCQERFQFTGHLESSRLLNSSNFNQFSLQFPVDIVNNITSLYPCLCEQKLISELKGLYCRPDLGSFKGITKLLQSFKSLNLRETFCEVTKLVKIIITTGSFHFNTDQKIEFCNPMSQILIKLSEKVVFGI